MVEPKLENQEIIKVAHRLAEVGGRTAMSYFRQPLDVISKGDESPVTIADRTAEQEMRKIINEYLPEHGIYGEEFGVENLDAEYVWALDPIDGTAAFVTGMPVFGVLISLALNKKPLLGVIEQPATKERWVGGLGQQTTLNGCPIQTSKVTDLSDASLYITTSDMLTTDLERQKYQNLRESVRINRFGGDCYAYGLLATGYVDLIMETQLKPYDFMALVPVVEGAGGKMTDWEGKPLTLDSGPQVLAAATEVLHAKALDRIN